MRKHHPKNERIKRKYFAYLEEAKRMNASSVDQAAAAIEQFEVSTGFRDFAAFNIEQARRFKRLLGEAINPATGNPLAKATTYSRMMAAKAFFVWLAGQSGYKSSVTYSDTEYFNPSNNDGRIAKAVREKAAPTLDQIRHVLLALPATTDIEKRDRALIAFTILSGARADAIASMKLRHIDVDRRTVFQDARDVRTKNRKTFTSVFFPVGEDIEAIVTSWVGLLLHEKLFGPEDPLFPATRVAVGEFSRHFEAVGLEREGWSNTSAIRRVFKKAFENAGLPYFNPHCFRNTLAALGEKVCKTPEQFKAWSQNLGHEGVLTTFTSYGAVARERQADILNGLNINDRTNGAVEGDPSKDTVNWVVTFLQRKA